MYPILTKSMLVLRYSLAIFLATGAVRGVSANQGGKWLLDVPRISAQDAATQQTLGPAIDLPQEDPFTCPLRLSPAEQSLLADAADGRLDGHSLVAAALISEQIHPAQVAAFGQKFAAIVEEVKREAAEADDAGRLQAIHRVLHRRLLKRYDAGASQLSDVFRHGRYNCISGTILFVAISEQLGVEVLGSGLTIQAVELPGHVRILVGCNGRQGQIEVTCPQWEHAVRWDENETNAAQAKSTVASRRVSSLGLLGMLYFNRGIDALHERRFSVAVEANRIALLLDADNRLTRGNLLAAVNNWALALAASGHSDDASFLITAGQNYEPAHQPFAHNAAYLRQLTGKGHE